MSNRSCSLEALAASDRILFDQFGRGPLMDVPFSHIHHAFERMAELYPSAIAVEQHDGTSITYSELERRANVLSNRLISQGLLPRQRICLVFQRSIYMVIAILAVLKANCQYVPLDGGIVPEETLQHILLDTQAPLVICLKKFEFKVRRHTSSVLVLDADAATHRHGAYIIYTSGECNPSKIRYSEEMTRWFSLQNGR